MNAINPGLAANSLSPWLSPSGVKRAFADGRFGQIHYRIARPARPERVPLVCLHMSPGSSRMYGEILARMGIDRFAVAPDTIGFGESDPPPEPKEIEDFAQGVAELLDTLGFAQIDLLGMHTGSKIAVELARQRPQQVRRVVIYGAACFTDDELAAFKQEFAGVPLAEDGSHLKTRWDMYWKYRGPGMGVDLIQRELAESLRAGERYSWGHRASFNYNMSERITAVTQPVLVLTAATDDLYTQSLRAPALLKNGRLIDLPAERFGQGCFDTEAEEICKILRDFLDDGTVDPATADPSGNVRKHPPSPAILPGFVRRQFAESRHGQLHFRIVKPTAERDNGTPLVCFHTASGSGKSFANLMKAMGSDRTVIAPDNPGRGESDSPSAPPAIADYAHIMGEFIIGQGLEQVDLLGFHAGSLVATELALKIPKLVRKVVLYSAPLFSPEELESFRAHYGTTSFDEDGLHNVRRWQAFWPWRGAGQTIEMYASQFAEGLRWGPNYPWGFLASFDYPARERMASLTQPVLVLNPADDLQQQTRRITEVLPTARLVEIPDAGHGLMDTRTAEVAALLREFLG